MKRWPDHGAFESKKTYRPCCCVDNIQICLTTQWPPPCCQWEEVKRSPKSEGQRRQSRSSQRLTWYRDKNTCSADLSRKEVGKNDLFTRKADVLFDSWISKLTTVRERERESSVLWEIDYGRVRDYIEKYETGGNQCESCSDQGLAACGHVGLHKATGPSQSSRLWCCHWHRRVCFHSSH